MKYDQNHLRLRILQLLKLFPVPHEHEEFTPSGSCRFASTLLSSAHGYKQHPSKLAATMLEISVVCNAAWLTPNYFAWDII